MASLELAAALAAIQNVTQAHLLPRPAPTAAASSITSMPSLVSDASCSYSYSTASPSASYYPPDPSAASFPFSSRSSSLRSLAPPSCRKLSGMVLDALPRPSIDDLTARFQPLVLSPPAEHADWPLVGPSLQPVADTLRSPTLRPVFGQQLAAPLIALLRLSNDTSPPPRGAQTQIARTLGNLCVDCPENRNALFQLAAAEPLLDLALSALNDSELDASLVRAALGALYNAQLDHTPTQQLLHHHPTALATLFRLAAENRLLALPEAFATTWQLIQDLFLPSGEEEIQSPGSPSYSPKSYASLPAGSDPDPDPEEQESMGGLPSSLHADEDSFLPPLAIAPAIEATTLVLRAFLCPPHLPVYMAFLHSSFDATAMQAVQRSVLAISQDEEAVDLLLATHDRWWATTLVQRLPEPLALALLGNTVRTPRHCHALIQQGMPRMLSPIFTRAWQAGDAAVVASLLGIIKNLAMPLENRALLGAAGWVEHAFCVLSLPPSEGLGGAELIFRALTLVRLLSLGAVGNAVRAASSVASLTTLALSGTLSYPVRQEAARALAYVVQTLFLFPLPDTLPNGQHQQHGRDDPDPNPDPSSGLKHAEAQDLQLTLLAIREARGQVSVEPVVRALTCLLSAHEQLVNEALTALRVMVPGHAGTAHLIAHSLHMLPPVRLGPALCVHNTLLLLLALAHEGQVGPALALRAHLPLLAEAHSEAAPLARSLLHHLPPPTP